MRTRVYKQLGILVYRDDDIYLSISLPRPYKSDYTFVHNDLLSIELVISGKEIITSQGTWGLFSSSDVRNEARSIVSSNSIRLDAKEPVILSPYPFVLDDKALPEVIELNETETTTTIYAEHYAYKDLPGNPIHQRRIVILSDEREIRLEDRIIGKGVHQIESYFHLSPDVKAVLEDTSTVYLLHGDSTIKLIPHFKSQLMKISTAPIYYGYGFGRQGKELYFKLSLELPNSIKYSIYY